MKNEKNLPPEILKMEENLPQEILKIATANGVTAKVMTSLDEYPVPNIVHYVWFARNTTWRFHQFLSVLSAYKFIKPKTIYFHHDNEPLGKYWKYIKQHVENLKLVKMAAPEKFFGEWINHPEHKSDVARIQILQQYGGIYLDTDVLALKSFNPLRKFKYTMGIEYHGKGKHPGALNNGIIISKKNAQFLKVWFDTYRNFTHNENPGDYHSCVMPYFLQYRYPDLVHVEEKSLNYPSGSKRNLIYRKNYDFSNNYAMHLWFRSYRLDKNPESVKKLNSTYGKMARLILYNTTALIRQKDKNKCMKYNF